jgi:hypothetical protein
MHIEQAASYFTFDRITRLDNGIRARGPFVIAPQIGDTGWQRPLIAGNLDEELVTPARIDRADCRP